MTSDEDYSSESNTLANAQTDNALNKVSVSSITINGGTLVSVFGGGESMAYVGTSYVVVSERFTGNIDYVTGGGSNGYTDMTFVEVHNGTINVLQAVNRGYMQTANMSVLGGKINNAYASAEGDNLDLGVKGEAVLQILGGTVTNVAPGQQGLSGVEKEDATLYYTEDATVTNVSDNFTEDSGLSVYFNIGWEDEDTIQLLVKKGTVAFDEEEFAEFVALLNESLANDETYSNYEFDGFYVDKELTEKFDITKELLEEDTTVYINIKEKKAASQAKNEDILPPKTGDISIIGTILIVAFASVIGYFTISVLRKKIASM